MAFKKRNTEKVEIEKVDKVEKNSFPKYTPDKIRTFKEQAILALNILDSKGINIYDESRTPGMYLKSKNNASKAIVNKLLGKSNNSQPNQQTQQTQDTNKSLISKLLKNER